MKRQKRDRVSRAYHKGFTAAISGKNSEACPFEVSDYKEQWLGGWRDARTEMSRGYYT